MLFTCIPLSFSLPLFPLKSSISSPPSYTKVTQPMHRPPICPPTQASKQPDPPRTHCVCVFYSFFKINSLTFEGLTQAGNKATVGILSLAMKLRSFWTKQEVYEESKT